MANPEQLEILGRGTAAWNEWRRDMESRRTPAALGGVDLREANLSKLILNQINLRGADLTRADLSAAKLIEANLHGANLTGANLLGADLTRANLDSAGLGGVNLENADLIGANLSYAFLTRAAVLRADLEGANLEGAYLEGARFIDASLKQANLTEAICGRTVFGGVDLRSVSGLETVRHTGPSIVGVDTVYHSKAQIPASFLRGAGAPDDFISYLKSKLADHIEFYSCFISYASKDSEFAEHLHAELQRAGVRCWFAPKDLKIGDRFQEEIEKSIRAYDKLLIVLSANSVNSRWVEREVAAAFEREQGATDNGVVFPIRLDDAVLATDRPWAADLRRARHIGDFRKWQEPIPFRDALQQLLRDLKSQSAKASDHPASGFGDS